MPSLDTQESFRVVKRLAQVVLVTVARVVRRKFRTSTNS